MEHTPGPWKIRNSSITTCAITTADNRFIVRLEGMDLMRVEDKSNAHLIAAAPDLLEALQELERQAHIMDNKHHAGMRIPARDWSNLYSLCQGACAAIAKARGIK